MRSGLSQFESMYSEGIGIYGLTSYFFKHICGITSLLAPVPFVFCFFNHLFIGLE